MSTLDQFGYLELALGSSRMQGLIYCILLGRLLVKCKIIGYKWLSTAGKDTPEPPQVSHDHVQCLWRTRGRKLAAEQAVMSQSKMAAHTNCHFKMAVPGSCHFPSWICHSGTVMNLWFLKYCLHITDTLHHINCNCLLRGIWTASSLTLS